MMEALNAYGRPFHQRASAMVVSARRMLTQTTPTQTKLSEIFNLTKWAPKKS